MLGLRQRLTIWARLLVLQAAWGYRRKQTNGLLAVAEPAVQHRPDAAALLHQFAIEFNTHPLLAPLLLGTVIRQLLQPNPDIDAVRKNTSRWMTSLSGLGDMIYWQAMWWTCVWTGACAYLLGGVWALLVFAALWLLMEIGFRIVLFELALRHDDGIQRALRVLNTPNLRETVSTLGVVAMAAVGGFVFTRATLGAQMDLKVLLLGAGAAAVSMVAASRSRFRSTALILPLAVGLLISLLE